MKATSSFLNLPLRTHSEALAEKREDIRQEAMGGDAATEEIDELQFLADKTLELFHRFQVASYRSNVVKYTADVLWDAVIDLRGRAQDIAERERNEQ